MKGAELNIFYICAHMPGEKPAAMITFMDVYFYILMTFTSFAHFAKYVISIDNRAAHTHTHTQSATQR